jgi:hypothetical protein
MNNMDHDAKPKIDRAGRMAQVVAAGGCSRWLQQELAVSYVSSDNI